MIKYIIILFSLLNLVYGKCPENAGAALQSHADLISCDCKTLRKFYEENDCCIVNLAGCNNIEKAWELSRNIINWKPLCPSIVDY